MHPYATDSHERKTVPLILAMLAIGSAYGLSWLLGVTSLQDKLWWLEIPSVLGFYGFLWWLFDRCIWKWKLLRTVGLVRVPDFNGRWRGHGISSYLREDGNRAEFDFQLEIGQEWTRLHVRMETAESASDSLIGAIVVGDGRRATLSYEYESHPRASAVETMQIHRGSARLERVNDDDSLEGEYYTGRGRQNYGEMKLQRISR